MTYYWLTMSIGGFIFGWLAGLIIPGGALDGDGLGLFLASACAVIFGWLMLDASRGVWMVDA
jgi:hypothetical protein